MVRTQIQLPDALYDRAKRVAERRETSLAELIRRGLELLLDQYPEHVETTWELPCIDIGRLLVPLERLRDVMYDDLENQLVTETPTVSDE